MQFYPVTKGTQLWDDLVNYAAHCPWRAGVSLTKKMNSNFFTDWQTPVVAILDNQIIGFCTITKTDSSCDEAYLPFIGYIYVDEKHRGKRISAQLINFSIEYLQSLKFHHVHIISDHIGLYEKYGFHVVDTIVSKNNQIC